MGIDFDNFVMPEGYKRVEVMKCLMCGKEFLVYTKLDGEQVRFVDPDTGYVPCCSWGVRRDNWLEP